MNSKEEIVEKIFILEDFKKGKIKHIKEDKKKNCKHIIYKRASLKPKLYFTFLIYLFLILLFMTLPLLFILLF